MSIASMCKGTIIRVARRTGVAVGAAGGEVATTTTSNAIECGGQQNGAGFDRRSDAESVRRTWRLFFPVAHGLTVADEVLVDRHRGESYATSRRLRINGHSKQGSPDGSLQLWIVDCEEY